MVTTRDVTDPGKWVCHVRLPQPAVTADYLARLVVAAGTTAPGIIVAIPVATSGGNSAYHMVVSKSAVTTK